MSTVESDVPTLVFLDLADQAPAKIFSIKMLAASDISAFLVCGACVCRFLKLTVSAFTSKSHSIMPLRKAAHMFF